MGTIIKQGVLSGTKSFPSTTPEITAAASLIIDEVNNGDRSAVETMIRIKAIGEYLKAVEAGIKQAFVAEMDTSYDPKVDHPHKVTFKLTTTPTKWSYDASDDHKAYEQEIESIKADMKALEKKMQIAGLAQKVGGGERTYSITLSKE